MRSILLLVLSSIALGSASAALAGDPPRNRNKPPQKKKSSALKCEPGYTGPIRVFATGYVSWKKGEKRCDPWGGQDLPGPGGLSRPSLQRYKGNPKDGWVMVAIPDDASYYKRTYKVIGGTLGKKPFSSMNGTILKAMDLIGTPNSRRTDSAIGQVDVSMSCEALAEWKRNGNPYLQLCVQAKGGSRSQQRIQRKPGAE